MSAALPHVFTGIADTTLFLERSEVRSMLIQQFPQTGEPVLKAIDALPIFSAEDIRGVAQCPIGCTPPFCSAGHCQRCSDFRDGWNLAQSDGVAQAAPDSGAKVREAMELAVNIIHGSLHVATRERNYAKAAEYQSYIDAISAVLPGISGIAYTSVLAAADLNRLREKYPDALAKALSLPSTPDGSASQ